MKTGICALLIMSKERSAPLVKHLEACGTNLVLVSDCRAAEEALAAGTRIHVVLTEEQLPDGDWRYVLTRISETMTGTQVIVCARLGDTQLWCEVIQNGAYDLLAEPYDQNEVRRIVESAALQSESRRPPQKARPSQLAKSA